MKKKTSKKFAGYEDVSENWTQRKRERKQTKMQIRSKNVQFKYERYR